MIVLPQMEQLRKQGMPSHKFTQAAFIALSMGLAACAGNIERTGIGSYMAASHAIELKDIEAASEFFNEALKREPDNPVILAEAFEFEVTEGNFPAALRLADRLDSLGAANAPAEIFLALEAFKKRNWQAARAHLASVRGLGLDSLIAPLLKGWMLTIEGDLEGAFKEMDGMSKVAVFNQFRQTHMAFMYDYADEKEKALTAYAGVLQRPNLRSLQPLVANASLLVRNGEREAAEAMIEGYLKRLPESPVLKDTLERIRGGQTFPSIARRPERALAYSLLNAATQLARDRVNSPAILYARLSQFMYFDIEETNLLLANILLAEDRTGTARRALEHIPADSPFSDFARVREAHALRREKKDKAANRVLRRFLEREPDNVLVRSTLADFLRESNQFEAALKQYSLAVESSSKLPNTDWFLYFSRGVTFDQLDRWDEAEQDLRKALDLNPEEPTLLNYLGYSLIDRGKNYDEAKGFIEKAVANRPNDGAIVDSMGWVQFLLGDFEEAVENLERAVELAPTDPIINEHLGDAYWMVDRRLEARFQWRHALVQKPEEKRIASIESKIALGLTVTSRAKRD